MSHLEDLPLSMQLRIPMIKHGKLNNWTQEQIATECKVSRRTIYRTLEAWIQTDDFIKWAREIFASKIGKVSDKEALKAATSIIVKDMATKAEIKSEHREEIISKHVEELNVNLADYETAVQAVVNRYIRTDSNQK